MHTRQLGRTDLTVSALGLGCMGMSQGYGKCDDAGSLGALNRALEVGITFWDTAQSYGPGHNEQLLGNALKQCRHQVQLATKFGIVRGRDGVHVDASPERVQSYCDASLQRLECDYVDLYYLHRIDPTVPVEDRIGAMAELVSAGKVRHLGISECTPDQLERAAAVHPIAAMQFEWSLWWREPERDVIPMARRLGIGLVPYSPLGRGFFAKQSLPDTFPTGDFRQGDARFDGKARDQDQFVLKRLHSLAAELDRTPAQLALGWLLAQGIDVVPIPGTRSANRLTENARAATMPLSTSDLQRIEEIAGRGEWQGDRKSFAAYVTRRSEQQP